MATTMVTNPIPARDITNNIESGLADQAWVATPPKPDQAKLTIVQITDVYTLENFASLKTMLQQTRNKSGDSKVVSVLTGDFLAPYLLSSVDQGYGMMKALAQTPIDYLMWGNHEADIDHKIVCKHVKNFPGTFINTNMQDHDAMKHQVPFEIIEVPSPDGSHCRRVGLIAVLSDDPALYRQFDAPGAFGGATIRNPWEVLKEYKEMLEGAPYNCDLVIPLEHVYVPEDHITCSDFDFPIVLSGHDHHRVDETVDGTRLIKPGCDAEYAAVVEVCWDGQESSKPTVTSRFVKATDWEPCPILLEVNIRAYDPLVSLRMTELARVPKVFEPLSSHNSRSGVTSMGTFICSLLRSSMNAKRGRRRSDFVDSVILMGGNLRGNTDYPEGSYFSLEALEAEIESGEEIGVVDMPGWVLAKGIQETHAGDPVPGWLQYDGDIKEEYPQGEDGPSIISEVAGNPFDPTRTYRIATKIGDLTNGQSTAFTEYYTANPKLLPAEGSFINISVELMGYFARNLWRKIWESLEPSMLVEPGLDSDYTYFRERFADLDNNQDGFISVDDIHAALRDVLGLNVHCDEMTLAESVHAYADVNNDGDVTVDDLELFSKELPGIYERDRWRLAYAKNDAHRLIHLASVAASPRTVALNGESVAVTQLP
ncbi:hypothetical protein MHU86_21089 [Fragilaria crotonensis]|nr:hypothetical protein MHU86_21089 [Fragilaria crotonensis]